jgi:hypothetical protein
MKFLVEFLKTGGWFAGTLGTLWGVLNHGLIAGIAVFVPSAFLVYWCIQQLIAYEYQDRLAEYANYKMPVFIVQDPERTLQVDSMAKQVREALELSGNTLLNPKKDVHEIYFQDPRFKAAVENPAQYLQRIEQYKLKVNEDFLNNQLKSVESFDQYKAVYFNQDLTPPSPMRQRFGFFNWG